MSEFGVIIVAAGQGKRMMSELPKQFLNVASRPILVHSIERFLDYDNRIEIVIVLNADHLPEWERIKEEYLPGISIQIAIGGKERFDSVKSGLDAIKTSRFVAIHDAVRPCVDQATIQRTFKAAKIYGSAIPVMPLKDSIRQLEGDTSKVVDRNNYRVVQTPQTFDYNKIAQAYRYPIDNSVTDDATIYQSHFGEIHLVDGNYENLKITTQEDLLIAEVLLNKKLPN
ncbi:MAG: 2-C-methyl-D-erythritol 4-phosphate cytidylyltransferase [Bacteroidota bacterium]